MIYTFGDEIHAYAWWYTIAFAMDKKIRQVETCRIFWQGQEDRSNTFGFAKLRPTVLEWLEVFETHWFFSLFDRFCSHFRQFETVDFLFDALLMLLKISCQNQQQLLISSLENCITVTREKSLKKLLVFLDLLRRNFWSTILIQSFLMDAVGKVDILLIQNRNNIFSFHCTDLCTDLGEFQLSS